MSKENHYILLLLKLAPLPPPPSTLSNLYGQASSFPSERRKYKRKCGEVAIIAVLAVLLYLLHDLKRPYIKHHWLSWTEMTKIMVADGLIYCTVRHLIRAGIFKKSMGARHRGGIGLSYRPAGFSYRPARLHRLAEFIPWNQFRGPINI